MDQVTSPKSNPMKLVFFVILFSLTACVSSPTPIPTPLPTPTLGALSVAMQSVIELPQPRTKGTLALEETLAQRRSVREFSDEPVTLADLGQLLWAAQGVTSSIGQRTAPSAGGLYPLQVYAVMREGVYHYEPAVHQLRAQLRGDQRLALFAASLEQDAVKNAPLTIVIAGDYARTASKYGDRAPRYVHLEAGHAAQNILLQAVALNLGAVTIGAFDDDKVKQVLALPAGEQPLYVIPIGHRK